MSTYLTWLKLPKKSSKALFSPSCSDPVEKLQQALDECKEMKSKVSAREKEVEEEINAVVSRLMDSLTKQKGELLEQCHTIAQSKCARLDLQMEQLLRLKQQMEHCSEEVSNTCISHSPFELLPVRELMTARFQDLNGKFCGENLCPCTNAEILAIFHSQSQVGDVSEPCHPLLCVLEVPVGKPATCEIGERKKLRLVTRDKKGDNFTFGGARVEASLSNVAPSIPVEVTDNQDGTYSLSFILNSPGDCQLHVKVNGHHIMGSPFRVQVHTEKDEIQMLLSKQLVKGEKR